MNRSPTLATAAALVALMAMPAGTVSAQYLHGFGPAMTGSTFYATGGTVWVRFVGSTAGYTNDLYQVALFGTSLAPQEYLFTNHSTSLGAEKQVTQTFAPGEEVIFGIYVRNTGQWFYSGDGSRNADGLVHVKFWELSGDPKYSLTAGFEDLYGGGDNDFNDVVFDFGGVTNNVVPEPASVLLLATGLVGIVGAGLRRRRVDL